jgi:hypothetical protein
MTGPSDVERGRQIVTSGKYSTTNGDEPDWPADDPGPPEPPPPDDDDEHHAEPRLAALLLTRTALKDLPDPQPLIDTVLDQGTNGLLYGPWGTGKTFIALDWAASVATGRPWQGHPTEQRRALYIVAEGAFGLKARVEAWETGWHTSITDDALHILPRPVNLTNAVEVGELAALIDHNGYGFIIFDTLARCMVGADENSAQDCGRVVDNLTWLRQRTPGGRGCIWGVHHTGKDGKTFRGSSVFEAGADVVYNVSADNGAIILNREKRRDGPRHDNHRLKLEAIAGAGSCTVSVSRDSETTVRGGSLLSHFLSHFAVTGATGAQLRDSTDMPKATFYRALNDLLRHGDLVNVGTEKRPLYRTATT